MSSPLPRLKRARRTPLWSNATSFKKDEKHNTADHKTPASITPSFGFAASNISQSTHDQIIKGIMQGKTPNDDCLLSSMAARLSMVERGLLSSKREIIEKDNKIRSLEELLAVQRISSTTELEAKCSKLQKQINEMKQFLNDYGMVWVGVDSDEDTDHTHSDAMWCHDSSMVDTPTLDTPPGLLDFDKLIRNIKELNILAGEDTSVVCKSKGRATLKQTGSIPLTLYQNGLVLFQGPYRPYSDPLTQACIKDLMDGFFPSELQSRFPDGIPFQLSDMRSHVYDPSPGTSRVMFPGKGYTLKDAPTSNESHPSLGLLKPHPFVSFNEPHPLINRKMEKSVSLERFLSRMPKKVIKNGRVINIHSELRGDTIQESIVPINDANSSSLSTTAQTIFLRIKFTDNKQVIMKMNVTNSIRELRQRIDKLRSHDWSHDYSIKTRFPSRTLSDDDRTLLEYDLTRSCNVFIQHSH